MEVPGEEGAMAMIETDGCRDKARKIRFLGMNVNGVLTNGQIFHLGGLRQPAIAFDSHDGAGIGLAQKAGIVVAFMTGYPDLKAILPRAKKLGVGEAFVYRGDDDKRTVLKRWLNALRFSPEQAAFIGDDLGDAVLFEKVGMCIAVASARPEIRLISDLVTEAKGGEGAVREAIEYILKAQGEWNKLLLATSPLFKYVI